MRGVYFVDYFASGELGTTLVGIQTRSQDFINLRNDINVGHGGGIDRHARSETSIKANGQFTLDIEGSLLSRFDEAWAEVIGAGVLRAVVRAEGAPYVYAGVLAFSFGPVNSWYCTSRTGYS